MLTITIQSDELFDEERKEFITIAKDQTIVLEHSLVSLSKWESIWEKPFLTKDTKTREESIDYVRCMTLTQNVDPIVYMFLNNKLMAQISDYIEKPMTATTFSSSSDKKTNSEIVTAELIYYWMIAFNIPLDCQKWHLNRLLTLINVCNIKNQPKKKMSANEIRARNARLNQERREKLNSKG